MGFNDFYFVYIIFGVAIIGAVLITMLNITGVTNHNCVVLRDDSVMKCPYGYIDGYNGNVECGDKTISQSGYKYVYSC